jgi:AcrR family transcriptional regulator
MSSSKTNNKMSPTPQQDIDKPAVRRRYESPVRQQQSAETKERIIVAGSELVHSFPAWDWRNLTARAVGERAGISERTVHRYFPTERKLRDAVLRRLVEESGLSLEHLELEGFASVTASMFNYLSSFAVAPTTTSANDDPTFATMDHQRRDALLRAVARATPRWSDHEQETAAAVLDILWNIPPYERLITSWGFDAERATGAITWLIGLIKEAIQQGRKPDTRT